MDTSTVNINTPQEGISLQDPAPAPQWEDTEKLDTKPTLLERLKKVGLYLAYLLLAWPVHLGLFIASVFLISAGFGTLIVWVGIPILMASVLLARFVAIAQRKVHAYLTGRPEPEVVYYRPASDAPLMRRLLGPLRDPQSLLDVLWALISFPVSLFTWCVTVGWCSCALGILSPITEPLMAAAGLREGDGRYISIGAFSTNLGTVLNLPNPVFFNALFGFLIGVIFLLTLPFVITGLAKLQLGFGEYMLSARARDEERIAKLKSSRTSARDAEASSLRRLERDLHDGPQQRLVRLNMDLARAKRQAGSNPEKATEIIDQAMTQAQDTLAEIRQLSRGIAPPVLVDRGLPAAISEASARSTIPVTVHAELPEVPMHVATAAYFVVAESLVNVNKHSQASAAQVDAQVMANNLVVTVTDNGKGGADVAKGHGLAGLVERLNGVDGTLSIVSPIGGPTTLKAVIPCES